jgi:uncharacterized protein
VLFDGARPRTRHAHWQRSGNANQLLVVNGTQLFCVGDDIIEQLENSVQYGDAHVEQTLVGLGLWSPALIDDMPLTSPALRALSLAVAQTCNLGCTYCYAGQGDFGGAAKKMRWPTARQAIETLLHDSEPSARYNLAFLGGEPLANRAVVRSATEYAAEIAAARGLHLGFSITTNGTLLIEDDAEFFERHGFAVTLSLDGLREDHDRQRPFKHGGGSYDRIMARVRPLLDRQKRMQVSVRTTVAAGNLRLRETLEYFLGLGFHSVGFSPVLHSPDGRAELAAHDLSDLLEAMVECGLEFERRVLCGDRYAFANMVNALHELHRGTHRPYPCGAGAGYLGASADGDLAACHRFVGDSDRAMGNLLNGIDRGAQNRWLAARHVHTQAPCQDCWARYLCAGGCHHEVLARGRTSCDYIRGWLHYCLQAYARLLRGRPDWFGEALG